MVEKQIIKLFCEDKKQFVKFYKYAKLDYLIVNYSNIYKLFSIINTYYSKYEDKEVISKEELDLSYNTNYFLKEQERKEVTALIDDVFATDISNEVAVVELLEEHRKRALAGDIARISLDVEEGIASIDDLVSKFDEIGITEIEEESPFVTATLEELYVTQVQTPGLRWRLNWLNKSLGSLRKGDFGFIFARPETGKTTFLASEISHMITQTDGDILWFNNEEQGTKVLSRCYQAILGMTQQQMFSDRDSNYATYKEIEQDRLLITNSEDSTHYKSIEKILASRKPALIIFDQIDKITGFKGDRNDLVLKQIYQWAREIAKKYAPVIAVSQAGGTGEGKLWLTMDDVDGSKTGKQGEADWILGIGMEQDNTSRIRYLNISKNKLLGDSDTLPDLRHGRSQVLIKPEVARFEDI